MFIYRRFYFKLLLTTLHNQFEARLLIAVKSLTSISTMLHHLTKLPKNPTENPILLLMLHGYGSNEADLFSLSAYLPENLLIISVRAPHTTDYGGFSWYDIYFDRDANKFTDVPQAIASRELIADFIEELYEKYHFDREKSLLMGFSQGAILSYALALTYPEKIKNIIALSGYVNEEMILISAHKESLSQLNFFCSHGTLDPVIPIEWARKGVTYLENQDLKFQFKEYTTGHNLNQENLSDLVRWIKKNL